ncbi:MAG: ABC transporter permease [Vicinamibacterales bacterium]|nr:ABC transporter permease [Vicinamibacterales bacterium]
MRILESLVRDLRFAFRLIRQTPLVSGVAMLSLALGIGANVAIFTLVNALMLKALPVHQPERLVQVATSLESGGARTSFTNPQWEYLRDRQDIFPGMLAAGNARFNLNAGGEMRPVTGLMVNGRFFATLGVIPHLGRAFTEDDDRRGGGVHGPVAVISHGFWQREFGGAPDILGRPISLDGHAFTIVGVSPPGFLGIEVGRTFDVAIPLGAEPLIRGAESGLDMRSMWWLRVLARLAPGDTETQAASRLEAMRPSLREATMPEHYRPEDQTRYLAEPFHLRPAATGLSNLRERYSQPLFVLLGVVALVLLIACANMANLLLAQSAARRKELAVRLSLGASRVQIARQLLVESLVLAGLGTGLGIMLALWGSRALVALISTRASLVVLDLALDWRVLGFTAGVGLLTGLLFGVVPALRATRLAPAAALKDHARGVVTSGGRLGLGHGLVALQVALSFMLVFGAGLFTRTLVTLTTQEMGFETSRVLIAQVDLRRSGLEDTARPAHFERIREAVLAAPGVEAAAISVVTPIAGMTWNNLIAVPGYDAPERDRIAHFNRVTPGFFATLGTPILAGRDIAETDVAASPKVALVNEAFAAKFLHGEHPLGRTFTTGMGERAETLEIVGLVADAKYLSLREPAPPTMYTAWSQAATASSSTRFSVRVAGPPNAFRTTVLQAIASVDGEAVVDFRTFEEDLSAAVTQERAIALLAAFFGGLALLLAAIGLYGVMSYSVARRRNEIGIRIALGAPPARVMRQVFGHVVAITLAGLVAGAAAALSAGRFIDSLLFGLAATDRTMVVLSAALLGSAALAAGYLPARRASRVDPMVALREE